MTDSDAAIRAVALDAALAELQQWGVDRFSIEGVAHRCDLDAERIRQLWHHPRELIVDALTTSTFSTISTPDTGTLVADLIELAVSVGTYLNEQEGRRIARMLVVDSKSHTVDDETRQLFLDRHVRVMETILTRAAERGEIHVEVHAVNVLQLLVSPLQTFALYSSAPVQPGYCRAIAELVTRAVSTGR